MLLIWSRTLLLIQSNTSKWKCVFFLTHDACEMFLSSRRFRLAVTEDDWRRDSGCRRWRGSWRLEPSTLHRSPESVVAAKVGRRLQRQIWADVKRDERPGELGEKTTQTSSADEILWAETLPFSQLSPDICSDAVAVGCLAQQRIGLASSWK